MQRIELPVCGITIELQGTGGRIMSDLKTGEDNELLDAALDGIESMILSAAIAGVDVESPAFLEAIETSIFAAEQHFG